MRDKVSGAIAIPKASWGCAPALPNRIWMVFLRQATGNWKVFRCSSFLKMLPRCGRAAHICEANYFWSLFFLLQLHFWKLSNSNKVESWESRLQVRVRQRGNCSTLAGKSRGGTPFCRTLKTVFSKSCFCTVPMWNTASRKTNCIRFGKIAFLFAFVLFAGGCVVRIVYESFY